ncbi:MAG: alpha/beta hydrolase, partial [Thermoguttaceae bacterium]|nr:alpha/beta hydrolase [Thermoguttaceae bacterium]
LKMATTQPGGLVHDVAAGMIAPYDSWEHRTAVYQFVQDIPLSEHHRSWKKLGEVQEGLSLFREHPVSLIWGMKDWCFSPEFLKRFLQFFPEAEVHRLEKAGHYLVEDAAPEVIDIIREFVKKPFSD